MKKRTILLIVVTLFVLVASGIVAATGITPVGTAVLLLCDVCICLFLAAVALVFALRDSMKKTIYSYRNIGLLGGIIFTTVFFVSSFTTLLKNLSSDNLTLSQMLRNLLMFPQQFSVGATIFITSVCLLVGISNVVLMKKEGVCLANALGVITAILYAGGTVGVFSLNRLIARETAQLTPIHILLNTVIPLFLLLVVCYFECIFIGCAILGWKASRTVPDHDRDFIIVLGCSIDRRGGLLPLLKGRVNRAIRFAWEQEIDTGKPLKYVPSGGQGSNEIMSEGSAMELYLLAKGAEPDEVFSEKKSCNTYENMLLSKKIIDEMKPDAKIAFATTNYHILRSGILAGMAGFDDPQGVAGDTKWYFWPNGFLREFVGILFLNKRAHLIFTCITALSCLVVGVLEYACGIYLFG